MKPETNWMHPGTYEIPDRVVDYGAHPPERPPVGLGLRGIGMGRFPDDRWFLMFPYVGDFGWRWRDARPIMKVDAFTDPAFVSPPRSRTRVVPTIVPHYMILAALPKRIDDIAVLTTSNEEAVLFADEDPVFGFVWRKVPVVKA